MLNRLTAADQVNGADHDRLSCNRQKAKMPSGVSVAMNIGSAFVVPVAEGKETNESHRHLGNRNGQ